MNTHLRVFLSLSAVTLALTACRSKSVMLAEPQVEMPEVAGRTLQLGARAGFFPARSVAPARFPDSRPPNMDLRSEETEQAILNLALESGLGRDFEVGAFGGIGTPDSGCGGINAKYQFWGAPRATAKAGDLSAGLTAHLVGCRAETDGDSRGYFYSTIAHWDDVTTSMTLDLGASIGYRLSDLFAVYGGFALAVTRAESIVNQDATADGTDPGGVYSAHINGAAQSLALGGHWGAASTFFDFKVNWAHSNSDYVNPDQIGVGAKLGVQF